MIGFTTEGDVFVGLHSRPVTLGSESFFDPSIFIFSFESHERSETPQRFRVTNELNDLAYVRNVDQLGNEFDEFWVHRVIYTPTCVLSLGNELSQSWSCCLSAVFQRFCFPFSLDALKIATSASLLSSLLNSTVVLLAFISQTTPTN